MAFDITVFPKNAGSDSDGIEFPNVDKLSFVSIETYGKPPLLPGVAPDIGPPVGEGETVLYVATGGVAAVEVRKA